MNLSPSDAFAQEITDSTRLGHEEQIGYVIREDPVDLFRHGRIERAQAGLDVRNERSRARTLRRHERARESRIDIADDDDDVRALLHEDLLETRHHSGRLDGVRPGADSEM